LEAKVWNGDGGSWRFCTWRFPQLDTSRTSSSDNTNWAFRHAHGRFRKVSVQASLRPNARVLREATAPEVEAPLAKADGHAHADAYPNRAKFNALTAPLLVLACFSTTHNFESARITVAVAVADHFG